MSIPTLYWAWDTLALLRHVGAGTNACFAPRSGGLRVGPVGYRSADSGLLHTVRGISCHVAEVTKGNDLLHGKETVQRMRALTWVLMSG